MAQFNAATTSMDEKLKQNKEVSLSGSKNKIIYQHGNLLDATDSVIAHCANCYCTMGAGVALAIKNKYRYAAAADALTIRGQKAKLGKFSLGIGEAGTTNPNVYNLYGQFGFASAGKPAINYVALRSALRAMAIDLRQKKYTGTIGLPKMGAGLAGGRWSLIEPIIEEELVDWTITVYSI